MSLDIPALIYAAAVAGGGIFGYVKSKSVASLAAGLLFGPAIGYGAYQMYQDPKNVALFVGSNLTLGGLMWMRFYNSGKLMPAGIIGAMSLLMVARGIVSRFSQPALKTE